ALAFSGFANYYLAIFSSEIELRQRYLSNAIFQLRRYLSLSSGRFKGEASYILALAYYSSGPSFANLVINYLQQAIAAGFERETMNEYFALAHSILGQNEEALFYFSQINTAERTFLFYFNLAEAYAGTGQHNLSEQNFLRVINEANNDHLIDRARFRLGVLYLNSSRYPEAQQIFEAFLARHPTNADAFHYLGDVFWALGNQTRARQLWREAIRFDHSKQTVLGHLL
ncbi:MAG: tetratricopeptide repeat protein, partial [Spirochaetaceae bacterium]|nr:tetratricopeptide repeat protein [Spirochaetaceae bacterium]